MRGDVFQSSRLKCTYSGSDPRKRTDRNRKNNDSRKVHLSLSTWVIGMCWGKR